MSDPVNQVIVVLNVHGVAQAFGPYDDNEAHDVAEFASKLLPTWRISLTESEDDRGLVCRYGVDGLHADQPQNFINHPTRGQR